MGRIYYASIDGQAISAVTDIFWIGSPTDAVTALREISITQDDSETSLQVPLRVFRTATDNSASGTGVTPRPTNVGDAAFGGNVRSIITGAQLSAETTPLFHMSQNALNGWFWLPPPEHIIYLSPTAGTAGYLAIKIDATVTLNISGYIVIEEIGG